MFRIARKKAGLPDLVVLYSARHTFGTDLLDESKNMAVTMKAMGHGSTRMMMRYQHPEYVDVARAAINRRNAANLGQVLVKRSKLEVKQCA
jgi:integrase